MEPVSDWFMFAESANLFTTWADNSVHIQSCEDHWYSSEDASHRQAVLGAPSSLYQQPSLRLQEDDGPFAGVANGSSRVCREDGGVAEQAERERPFLAPPWHQVTRLLMLGRLIMLTNLDFVSHVNLLNCHRLFVYENIPQLKYHNPHLKVSIKRNTNANSKITFHSSGKIPYHMHTSTIIQVVYFHTESGSCGDIVTTGLRQRDIQDKIKTFSQNLHVHK